MSCRFSKSVLVARWLVSSTSFCGNGGADVEQRIEKGNQRHTNNKRTNGRVYWYTEKTENPGKEEPASKSTWTSSPVETFGESSAAW